MGVGNIIRANPKGIYLQVRSCTHITERRSSLFFFFFFHTDRGESVS